MKKIYALFLAVLVLLTPGCKKDPKLTEVTSVTLDKTVLVLEVGDKTTLTASIAPANASDKTITWGSNKDAVATVDKNGEVTAVAEGEAIITATTANGKTVICTVTVIPVISESNYTIGEVTKAINSAAYYYNEDEDGYTIHLLESKNPVFTDEDVNTYYPLSYAPFAIDIAGSAIGIKCDFKNDGDILNNKDWVSYISTFDSDGTEHYIYDLDGSILVNLTEDGTLIIVLDAIDTDGVVYKAKCSIKAIAVKYYLCPIL